MASLLQVWPAAEISFSPLGIGHLAQLFEAVWEKDCATA